MNDPTPVTITGPVPIPVAVTNPRPETVDEVNERSLKTSGQRKVNLIWERTQAMIAVSVVATTLLVNGLLALYPPESDRGTSALMQLNVMSALVTGFYFGRTNHQRSGGVGGNEVIGGR